MSVMPPDNAQRPVSAPPVPAQAATVRYERTPAVTDTRRSFTITVGLTPGYGNTAAEVPLGTVYAAHAAWMCERLRLDQPYLTGVFHYADVSYAWLLADGTAQARTEPCARLEGEVSVLYAAGVHDDQVVDMLDELAGRLADAAAQERVYVAYRDRTWCLDRHELPPPDDEQPAI